MTKTYGETRRIDQLGRLTLPKHLRDKFGWEEGTVIFITNNAEGQITLECIEDQCCVCNALNDLTFDTVSCKYLCKSCLARFN